MTHDIWDLCLRFGTCMWLIRGVGSAAGKQSDDCEPCLLKHSVKQACFRPRLSDEGCRVLVVGF
jgi:hypothetical protein